MARARQRSSGLPRFLSGGPGGAQLIAYSRHSIVTLSGRNYGKPTEGYSLRRFGLWLAALPAALSLLIPQYAAAQRTVAEMWLTNATRTQLLSPQAPVAFRAEERANGLPTIRIDSNTRRQTIVGFGYTLTGGSVELLRKMPAAARHQLLEELFGDRPDDLQISELRLTMGSSDLSRTLYTYDDMPWGQADPQLRHFSLGPDGDTMVPLVREILAIRPGLRVVASPWTAPLWMKTRIPGQHSLWTPRKLGVEAICAGCLLLLVFAIRWVRGRRFSQRARIVGAGMVTLTCVAALVIPIAWNWRATHGHVAGLKAAALMDDDAWPHGRWNLAFAAACLDYERTSLRAAGQRWFALVRTVVTNGKEWGGGELAPADYDVYARYFVRYLEEMRAAGIPIRAVTVQNESVPMFNRPSMGWSAEQQRVFVADYLGPALRRAGLPVGVIVYDHNADKPEFPMHILGDPAAARFVDGTAFHLYSGSMSALSEVHAAFPDKSLYFTEQMVIEDTRDGVKWPAAEPLQRIFVGALRNWSRDVLLWNLASDPDAEPHILDGGCPACLGAVTLDGTAVTRNLGYYTLAHLSRFVPPGSKVLLSNDTLGEGVGNVAFETPAGDTVLLVTNEGAAEMVRIVWKGRETEVRLEHNAAATLRWR